MSSETETKVGDGEGLEIAHPEDFGVKRDGDGNLLAQPQRIPGTEKAVMANPLVGGDIDEWEDVLESAEVDDDRLDEFFQEFIEEGIGSNGIQDVPDYMTTALIEAVKNSSGHEVFQHLQQRKEQRNLQSLETLDKVPEDLLMKFMEAQGADTEALEGLSENESESDEKQNSS